MQEVPTLLPIVSTFDVSGRETRSEPRKSSLQLKEYFVRIVWDPEIEDCYSDCIRFLSTPLSASSKPGAWWNQVYKVD
jgi:hypothetical protein